LFIFVPAILRDFRPSLQLDAKRLEKIKAAFLKLKNYDLPVIRNPSRLDTLHFGISPVPL
jgi:hypothetical protein